MNVLVVLGIALALAMDAFAVAMGVSLMMGGCSRRQTLRLAWHFGLFQLGMPILGWAAGRTVIGVIRRYDHWVAAALLVFVAGKMIHGALKKDEKGPGASCPDLTRGGSLVVLSLATSLDALAVGLSLAALGAPVVFPALIIGIVAFVLTAAGTKLGPILGKWVGRWAEVAGGLVLIAIAVKILADHLGG